MSITKNNIGDFITFLYKKRKGEEAPAELIQRWKGLSNDEIAFHLSGLFHSWGLTDEDKRMEINAFFKETLFPPKTQQPPKVVPVAVPQQSVPAFQQKKKRKWPVIVIVSVLLIAGIYLGYQYTAYASMKYIYTITDNVLVRNESKEVIARMDLYEVKSNIPSFQKLKAVDKEIHYRSIDNSDKTYPCRKVLLQEGSFWSYLFNKKSDIGYVNTNYVVDNVTEFNLYQTAFKEVKNNKAENADLKAIYRKIIIGSMSLDPSIEDKYIALHSNGLSKATTDATYGIIKQTIKESVKYVIIAGLSDGFYYSFEGDIQTNDFSPPEKIMVTNADKETQPLRGAYRFMNKGNTIILYDCITHSPTDYEAERDSNGRISSFVYNPPNLLEEIFGGSSEPEAADTAGQ